MDYVASGQAEKDWHTRMADRLREMEELFCVGEKLEENIVRPPAGAVDPVSGPVAHTIPGEPLPENGWHRRFQREIEALREFADDVLRPLIPPPSMG